MSEQLVIGIDPSLRGCGLSNGAYHSVVSTKAGEHIDDRINEILDGIWTYAFDGAISRDRTIWLVVEAPLLRVMAPTKTDDVAKGPRPDGSALFEVGNLMRAIRHELVGDLRADGFKVVYLEVGIGALRHFIVGCGNAPKAFVPYMVEQIYGITFDRDRGMDKLVAWSLVKYGRAVAAGEHLHQFAAPRGQGRSERANRRKAARTRASGAA